MDMIEWLRGFLQDEDTKLIYFLCAIAGANVIDFMIGWVNAKFNPEIQFSSTRAIMGLARKMILLILSAFFIPVAVLLLPNAVALPTLYVFLGGYLVSELNSIGNHLNLLSDDKQNSTFLDFIKMLGSGGKKQ